MYIKNLNKNNGPKCVIIIIHVFDLSKKMWYVYSNSKTNNYYLHYYYIYTNTIIITINILYTCFDTVAGPNNFWPYTPSGDNEIQW